MSYNSFFDEFNRITEEQFDYLKLSAINVDAVTKEAEFVFVYPEQQESVVKANIDEIKKAVYSATRTKMTVLIKLKKSHFDEHFFIYDLLDFLKSHPAFLHAIDNRSFSVYYAEDVPHVVMSVKPSAYEFLMNGNVTKEIEEYISHNYCEPIVFEVKIIECEEVIDYDPDAQDKLMFEMPGGRYINVNNVDGLIGSPIYEKPIYICDAKPKQGLVLCGKVLLLRSYEYNRKVKEGEEPRKGTLYKFNLEDPTGTISCIYFPSAKTLDKIQLLVNDKEIVVKGDLEVSTFRNNESLSMRVRSISYCSLPTDFKINRIKCLVPEEYKYVFPKPYEAYAQDSIFAIKETRSDYLKGKNFCVFDIETTGLVAATCQIIEIAAIKIENGQLTEVFSTFVDPQCKIPDNIIALTHITDKDVAGAPIISEVIPDFYKFIQGCVLVGHNSISFDFPFISTKAADNNIYFDNDQLDTMLLAQKFVPNLRNYTLSTLVAHFKVGNDGAHRAINDAVATAKVFIELANFM